MSKFHQHQASFRRAQELLTRREALHKLGAGFGSIGLAASMAQRGALSAASNLLTPKAAHFAPKAKRVIQLFMPGGPSQIDTFDYKPDCAKYRGQRPDIVARKTLRNTKLGLMPSFFPFKRYGECGKHVSDLFPHVAQHVDDICFIHSMHTDIPEHAGGILMMNCGHLQSTRPSMGAWLGYGLGSENQDLPAFVAMSPRAQPRGTLANWGNAFLPGAYAGSYVNIQKLKPNQPIPDLVNPDLSKTEQRRQADLMIALNKQHLERLTKDQGLEASIDNMELAFRMQFAVPELFDISQESKQTLEMYGDSEYAKGCLLARRMIERGVRCVQLSHSISGYDIAWDTGHNNIPNGHKDLAVACDQGIAALITDLKRRGLFDETLLVWGGEFGRAPTSEGKLGRDHDHYGYTVWMAGGGVKGGMSYGATDNFGCTAVENRVHVHDLHATILHLMGLDHEKLTYRYSGRDYRLTDVHGQVIHDIIA
jgi:hypothetical protein